MNYRKLKYVRYADDFLIGIIGSKQDAIIIKEDIKNFLYEKLALETYRAYGISTEGMIHHSDRGVQYASKLIRARSP